MYNVWLRLAAISAALCGAVVLVGPSLLFSRAGANLPWNEEHRILAPGKAATQKPSTQQAQLTSILRYRTQAEQDGSPRGNVNLLIYPDGTVKGIWNGDYDADVESHRVVMAASFAGNTDPAVVYTQGTAQDPSRLFFITRGTFSILETRSEAAAGTNINGYIYVRGWIDTDLTVTGDLIITENKKSFETFSWAARPSD